MPLKLTRIACVAAIGASTLNAQTPRESPLASARASQLADSIVRLMTLEEKNRAAESVTGQGHANRTSGTGRR